MPDKLIAAYRVQLNSNFTFNDAAELAPYLAGLGISHLYCSPILQAAPGSSHGYDVVNHNKISQDLGGVSAYEHLCEVLKKYNIKHIIDVVPNHMAITGSENPWWWDVLENGQSSRYAAYFDVDWDPPQSRYSNLVVLPVLGDHYGRVLEAGDLKLRYKSGVFTIHYYEHMFPVDPRSLSGLLKESGRQCGSDELVFIAGALSNLPLATATDLPSVKQRHRDKEVLQQMLVRLDKNNPEVSTAISDVVNKINSDPDAFDELAGQQNYRLAFWRMAERDLGYRRFFDINDLIGLRVEDLQVFEDTHRLLFSLIEFDKAAGMRIDHPDGLRNPEYYFQNLKQACPNAWILAEKILEQDETLRDSWAVDGTTGYDFLNRLNGLFINPDNENKITDLYVNFTGESPDFKNLVYEKKMQVMREILGSDVNRLTGLLLDICERHRRYRDYTRYQLQQGLMQIAACFPVYRTYIRAGIGKIADEDIRYIKHAVAAAKEQNEELAGDVFDFIGALLLLQIRGELENEFVMQFQQFTAPVMAKGVEDTAFYCYNRLTSLNEVGGFPDRFGISVREFHQSCINTQKNWPGTLLASSTHDTKRSEDVRARLNLLSEIPDQWENAVRHWSKLNDRYHKNNYPDRNAEYLLYQTMTGAWPVSEERILAYMEKASREAKVYTSWTRPDKDYDAALKSFILSVYKNDDFINSLENFVSLLSRPGWINALSQTLVKLTAPGVPDIYQGTEVWNYSLVDPDNRRPVDFNLLKEKLNALKYIQPDKIVESMDDGLAKLWVIKKTLNLRAKHPEYFGLKASYTPVEASGPKSDHVFAFMREEKAVTIVPRLIMSLNNDWQDTKIKIPSGNWVNELTGEKLKGGDILLSQLLFHFPVSLLSKEMTNK